MDSEYTTIDGLNNRKSTSDDTQFNTSYHSPSQRGSNSDENTTFDNQNNEEPVKKDNIADTQNKKKSNRGNAGRIATGVAAGVIIGVTSSAFAASTPAPHNDTDHGNEENTTTTDEVHAPHEIKEATTVTDDMSFNQAFGTARHEVGAGGVFTWRGHTYGTYLKNEWDSMSSEEKDEYFASVANHSHHTSSNSGDDNIEGLVVDENHDTSAENENQENENDENRNDEITQEPIDEMNDDLTVLGVVHDDETGWNIEAIDYNGETMYFVDVDDDLYADWIVGDFNHNNQLEDNEVIEIPSGNDIILDIDLVENTPTDGYDPDPVEYQNMDDMIDTTSTPDDNLTCDFSNDASLI